MQKFRIKYYFLMKSVPDALYIRYVSIHAKHVSDMCNTPLRHALSEITGIDTYHLPKKSNELIKYMRKYRGRRPQVEYFHRHLFNATAIYEMVGVQVPYDFLLQSEFPPFTQIKLSFAMFDFDNRTVSSIMCDNIISRNSNVWPIAVSCDALFQFVKFMYVRNLYLDEIKQFWSVAWEVIYLADFFGIKTLMQLMTGIMNIAFNSETNLSDDDYFYMFLYSVLFDLPVMIEKLGTIVLAILGQNSEHLHVFKSLAFSCPSVHNRISKLLSDEPNYFSNCQVEIVSAKGCYRPK